MKAETVKIGKRGAMVIPMALRKTFGLVEGSILIAENHGDGVLLRPATTVPVEIYSAERKAEFLLNNAVDETEYLAAVKEVKSMGLNPKKIPHKKYF